MNNELTIGALDPSSKQPELKHCAVRIEAADLPWRLTAYGITENASALMQDLELAMNAVPYAVRTLTGRERTGVRLSLAAKEAPGEDLLRAWLKDLGESEAPRGRTVCNCFDVTESEIEAVLSTSKSLKDLQSSLRCGTNCGSCLPELRRMTAAAA